MLLLKIPCIIIAMTGLQITTTAPHPPAHPEELLHATRIEVVVNQRSAPLVIKLICWFAAIAETLVILASHMPNLQVSKGILSTLTTTGTEGHIQVSPLFLLGTILTGMGGLIRYKCYRELGHLFTFEMSIRKDHRLVITGPYSIVRHPGYSGVVLCVLGMIVCHSGTGSWARECGPFHTIGGQFLAAVYLGLVSLITFVLLSRMTKEDEALSEAFGEEWTDWAERVPCWLIPGIY